jgi:hypothetical protein
MAKDFLGWSKWSPHLGNAITIATGVPVVIAMATAAWASISPSRGLFVALAALAAFMMALWCCIGFLWLRDRMRPMQPIQTVPLRDCSWGLDIASIMLNYDPGSPHFEWMFFFVFVNSLTWPIRLFVDELQIDLSQTHAVGTPFPSSGIVINRSTSMPISLSGFRPGMLSSSPDMNGMAYIRGRYGHPDDGYSRVFTRRFRIECHIRGDLPSAPCPYLVVRLPIEETDSPIDSQAVPFRAQGLLGSPESR